MRYSLGGCGPFIQSTTLRAGLAIGRGILSIIPLHRFGMRDRALRVLRSDSRLRRVFGVTDSEFWPAGVRNEDALGVSVPLSRSMMVGTGAFDFG